MDYDPDRILMLSGGLGEMDKTQLRKYAEILLDQIIKYETGENCYRLVKVKQGKGLIEEELTNGTREACIQCGEVLKKQYPESVIAVITGRLVIWPEMNFGELLRI